MRGLLRIRDMRLYLLGQAFSMFGDNALWLAAAVWVKTLTDSNSATAFTFFVFALPQVFAPAWGVVVDHFRRRPLLIAVNLAMAAAMLPLLLVHDAGDVWIIYLVMAAYGAGGNIIGAAQGALLAHMLPDDLLGDANGALRALQEGLRLVAPLAGAGLFAAAGGGIVAMLDAGTFVIAAVLLLLMRVREDKPSPGAEESWWASTTAGFRHIRRTPTLGEVLLATATALLVVGFIEAAVFAVIDEGLHRPPAFIGVLVTAQGAGSVVSGLTAGQLIRRTSERTTVSVGLTLFAAGTLLLVPAVPVSVVAGMVLIGLGVPWMSVGLYTLLQRRTPGHLLGRVGTAASTLTGTPHIVSTAVGAALIAVVAYQMLLVVIATVVLGSAVFLFTRRADPAGEPALATGRLRVGDAAVRRLRIGQLEVDELGVRRLPVVESD